LTIGQDIHDKAWGKLWPTKTCTIHCSDIFPNETDASSDEFMDIEDDDHSFDHIPRESTFTCLLGVDLLHDTLQIPNTKLSIIVICKEYEFLRDLFEEKFVVTGQPGIGS